MRPAAQVMALVYSPDGKLLASLENANPAKRLCEVSIWDAATGRCRQRIDPRIVGYPEISFSPDGTSLWALGGEKSLVRVHLDSLSGRENRRLEFKDASPYSAAFLPEGRTLARLKDAAAVLVYDAAGKESLRIPVPEKHGWSLVPTRDGRRFASVAGGSTVRIYDTATGKETGTAGWTGSELSQAAFAADGAILALMSETHDENSGVGVWDLTTGKERFRIRDKESLPGYFLNPEGAWLSPDGKLLATSMQGDRDLVLWDVVTGKEVRRCPTDRSSRVAFSVDGSRMAVSNSSAMSLWEVATGRLLPASADPAGSVRSVHFTRDRRRLVGEADRPYEWDPATGRELGRYAYVGHDSWDQRLLSPDGSLIATNGWDGAVQLWNSFTGQEVRALKGHAGPCWTMVFSADGRQLYSAGDDKTLRIWDVASGREVHRFRGFEHRTSWLSASADGRWLASADAVQPPTPGAIHVLDLAAKREARTICPVGWVSAMAFSPDSRLLLANLLNQAHNEIIVWEAATGKPWRTLPLPSYSTGLPTISPDGRMVVSTSLDGTVRLWELATLRERRRLIGHKRYVSDAAFSSDGRLLAAASSEAPVYVWNVRVRSDAASVLSDERLERAWQNLAGADAVSAYQAVLALAANSRQAVSFLSGRLKPAAGPDDRQVEVLVRNLDARLFTVRRRAAAELERLGEVAEPALRKLLAAPPSAEARRQAERLLLSIQGPVTEPETRRAVRAVEALELANTPEAWRLLQALAKGASAARLTREAVAALARRDPAAAAPAR